MCSNGRSVTSKSILFWVALGAVLLASRLAHVNILWADEDYHLAAAIQILHGKMLYRDLWYDKPPLNALLLVLFGAWPGWPLRIASTVLALAGSIAMYQFAAAVWGRREGYFAAALLAFFQLFYFPKAILTLEPETLLVLPHILAVYWAWRGRSWAAGIAAGIGFLLHPRAAFILVSCLVFNPAGWLRLGLGFMLPNALAAAWLLSQGAFHAYIEQVWRWGLLYASSPPEEAPGAAWIRLAGWCGFHVALLIGAVFYTRSRPDRWRWIAWCAISLAASALGWRFAPHYLNILLPPLILMASAVLSRTRSAVLIGTTILALAVPAGRFGPRYFSLAAENWKETPHSWSDVRMDQESRAASDSISQIESSGDTLFIWGYRPNVVVYTRMPVASRFWDSQPLTGVPADRHLGTSAEPVDAAWAAANRQELIRSTPTILVDGLSAYNPKLDIRSFPDLEAWFSQYCPIPSTPEGMKVYRRCKR